MAMIEDLSVFFNPDEFADGITLNAVGVDAIFDDGYAQSSVGLVGMASAQPSLTLPTASVPANPFGLPVVRKGVSYLVAAHEPDDTGISRLILELA